MKSSWRDFVGYWTQVWAFCKAQPIWASAFFICGYIIGEMYFG